MAERRMFAKSIINSARFLRMPPTSRLLYYDLGMAADDDGVVEAFAVMRATGATEDDLKVLVAKNFVTILDADDLVTYINDWNVSNKIRADRKVDSIYQPLLLKVLPDVKILQKAQRADTKPKTNGRPMDNQWTTNRQPMDNQWTAEDRIGKGRIGKDSNKQSKIALENFGEISPAEPRKKNNYQAIVDDYNQTCTRLPKCIKLSDARKKAIAARLKRYSMEELHAVFEKAEASDFLCGCNARNWMANFDWLLKDANMAKVMDGNYDNEKPVQHPVNQYDVDLSSVFS